jgi:hypothetical protein
MLKPTKKNKIVHDSDSFEENEQDKETFCLVCLGPYNTSQEDWIQCRDCKQWAHVSCTDEDPYFVCIRLILLVLFMNTV